MTGFFDDLAEQVPEMHAGDISAVVLAQQINSGGRPRKHATADTPRQHTEDLRAIERIEMQLEAAHA